MNSEKVKEIKKALEDNKTDHLPYIDGWKCKFVEYADILTLINELESENERLTKQYVDWKDLYYENTKRVKKLKDRIAELESENERLIKIKENCLEIIKQGEQQIINIAKETLKDFREKYKEALKEAVKGENVDCFVESLKIFDKTIEEKICDLK